MSTSFFFGRNRLRFKVRRAGASVFFSTVTVRCKAVSIRCSPSRRMLLSFPREHQVSHWPDTAELMAEKVLFSGFPPAGLPESVRSHHVRGFLCTWREGRQAGLPGKPCDGRICVCEEHVCPTCRAATGTLCTGRNCSHRRQQGNSCNAVHNVRV